MPSEKPKPPSVVLAPGEVVVSASRLAALEAKVAELEKAPAPTADCRSAQSEASNLARQLAAARAGDPGYQKLEAKVNDLQNRLSQALQREGELRKKLNELVQIEKNARVPQGN
nr:hypothetical protein [Acidithiobacillus caldus]